MVTTYRNLVMETVEILDDDAPSNGAPKISEDDPWSVYTSWNQFVQPTEYIFSAAKLKTSAVKEGVNPQQDLTLIGELEINLIV